MAMVSTMFMALKTLPAKVSESGQTQSSEPLNPVLDDL